MVSTAIEELDAEIASIAEVDPTTVTRVVDTIELLASRERRLAFVIGDRQLKP